MVVNFNKAFKDEVIHEIESIEEIEGDNLLEVSLLGNKVFYSRGTQFTACIDNMNKEINSKVAAYSI